MRIAICDDDPKELEHISHLLNDYRQQFQVDLICRTYSDGVALLSDLNKENYDFIILDVFMPMINGMETAHEIRSFNKDVKIAFLTFSPEFALESYAVDAFTYLLKPVTKDALFPILNKLFYVERTSADALALKLQNSVANILFSKLAYVEVMNKKLHFHLSDGSTKSLTAPLSDFEDTLVSRPEFIRVHRSFIVNMWHIQELYSTEILTRMGDKIPVSRRLYSQVRKAYLKFLML